MSQAPINWDPADIRAAIIKKGSDLSIIAQNAGLHPSTVSRALREPGYSGELAIASFLGVHPKTIWPTRYDSTGKPRHPRIRRQINGSNGACASQKCAAE